MKFSGKSKKIWLLVSLMTAAGVLSLLGPVIITVIGGMVLVVVIALYLPIFTMSDVAM